MLSNYCKKGFITILLTLFICASFGMVSDVFAQDNVLTEEITEVAKTNIDSSINNEKRTYYIGILPLRKPSEMLNRFVAVEKHISEQTGLDIRLRYYLSSGINGGFTACVKDVVAGNTDFAFLAPVTCVQAQGTGPVLPFACAQKAGSPIYYGHLAVRIDSPYQSVYDLEGKKVCGTSASSTSGNLMPSGWLKSIGIDKFTFFDFDYAGRHDKAAQAVIIKQFEACFINEATFNQYNSETVQLRSLWRHPAVPEFPFCVNTDKVSPEVLEKVKTALLNMHEFDLPGVQAANKKYEKWVEIKWEDYLTVKDVIDDVHGEKFYDLEYWQAKADKKDTKDKNVEQVSKKVVSSEKTAEVATSKTDVKEEVVEAVIEGTDQIKEVVKDVGTVVGEATVEIKEVIANDDIVIASETAVEIKEIVKEELAESVNENMEENNVEAKVTEDVVVEVVAGTESTEKVA